MKKYTFLLALFMGLFFIAGAQTKKVVIQTPSVQCDMCKEKIEKYLSREPGVVSVDVNYKKKTTTVVYHTDRNNIEQLKTAIANIGYDADDVSADEEAYKKLPKCCKKPAAPPKETPAQKASN